MDQPRDSEQIPIGTPGEKAGTQGTLAFALIIASETPLVLLDHALGVVVASASFYRTFGLAQPLSGRAVFAEMGAGEWSRPQLSAMLHAIAEGSPAIEAYEMDLVRPGLPVCHLLLSAHLLDYQGAASDTRIVLAISDVTATRAADKLKDDLLREKQLLMQELQHRVANSLQIIASVLMQSARKVNSDETRGHLSDAHSRVMSIATLQKQLAMTQEGEVELRGYFTQLCRSIGASMIPDPGFLSLTVTADDTKVEARVSLSLGLIVTELVINSLKHAFPGGARDGRITVDFRSVGTGWTLAVADNGVGFPAEDEGGNPGLGTGIVEALATQLNARVEIRHESPGSTVSIVHD
jgi:two-component system, sensor histidine kinase PdtaS